MDNEADAVAIRDEYGLEYPVLYDNDHAVTTEWGLFDLLGDGVSAPAAFIIRTDGSIESALIGTNISERPTAESILEVLASMGGMDRSMLPAHEDDETDTPAAMDGGMDDMEGMEDAVVVRPTAAPEAQDSGQDEPSAVSTPVELEVVENIEATDTPAEPPSLVAVPVVTGPPVVGEPVPDFYLPTARGESISLGDYVGERNVVFVFFRAWW